MNATCVEARGCLCEHTEESESLTLKAVRLAEGLEQSVKRLILGAGQNLGDLELEVERQSREFQLAATEKAAQSKA
ncbi:MAG TPA: hypothetical protein VGY98_19070, partial [Verrucomicrobiae bacterium]|nr:hypothetical protein [Verrucomicrobiae bacterium]